MNKRKLILIGWTDFNSSYINWYLSEYFDIEPYNLNKTYANDCIFVISRSEYWHEPMVEKILEKGHKLILANQWEAQPFFLAEQFTPYLDNILVILGCKNSLGLGWKNIINVPNWFWYNESLWYTCESKMSYHKYIPNRSNGKLFFMPINRVKDFRTRIVDQFNDVLDRAIWSYAQQHNGGQHLPVGDVNPVARIAWDRQFEEWWYNDSYFTVTVESSVDTDLTAPCELFVTEKTFKPIAFQHPFLVCGMKGTLKFLHDNGFETFNHIFDESYDQLDFFENRLDSVHNNIKNFDTTKYLDPLTNEKIKHNYDRFYNRAIVLNGLKMDLLDPLLEWINAN